MMNLFDYVFACTVFLLIYMLMHGRHYYNESPFIMGITASFLASMIVNKIILTEMEPCRKN
jgi:hypothetical protein